MLFLALDSLCAGLALRATHWGDVAGWLSVGTLAKASLPAVWLAFSLTYARAQGRQALSRAWPLIALVAAIPLGIAFALPERLLDLVPPDETGGLLLIRSDGIARAFHGSLLVGFVLPLMNLEQTFRGAVGTMRWRIKYVVLGLGIIFGAYIFVASQAILFAAYDPALAGIESSALLVGGVFLVISYARDGLGGFEVYPSRAVLRSSLTVLIVGGYLFIVGVLAQFVRRFGGAESFQLQALLVLVGLGGLAVLLLSDRLRNTIQAFVGRHFSKAQHDSVRVWSDASRHLASVHDRAGLSTALVKLLSSTFDSLSVSVWLADERGDSLVRSAANSGRAQAAAPMRAVGDRLPVNGLAARERPFDLDDEKEPWAQELRRLNPATFTQGGHRWCVPIRTGETLLGAIVLADRVNGTPYSAEEQELLACMADQSASVLLNLRQADEIARGRELQAFQTMSAFFVHDLKNAAASLNLMLKNLPVHFDDPAFRADALRGIGNTARRIDEMIVRLSAFRQRPVVAAAEADLDQIVRDVVASLSDLQKQQLDLRLEPGPRVRADKDQIASVVTNLLGNARDASAENQQILVRTERRGNHVVLSVIDSGSGMAPEFVQNSLFRPFQTTKSKGLGIGMFQAQMIVQAHGGSIEVQTELGRGTAVHVTLPALDARKTQ